MTDPDDPAATGAEAPAAAIPTEAVPAEAVPPDAAQAAAGQSDPKAVFRRYLDSGRDALLFKLEDASEYDVRRPLTPTGTNLLGLVKHLSGVEAGYLGECFGRPVPEMPAWYAEMGSDDSEPNADMWATADESQESIVELYQRVRAHADRTIDELDLTAPGTVPWWGPDAGEVTLQRLLVHVIAEEQRHLGQADIVRENIDGAVGLRAGVSNLPDESEQWWADYHRRLQQTAEQFRQ
ncbi:DinB family protein [Nakamurella aerolata]|uniref:DinB family protein n=1 Tax=Nakamurella aerolata TaxID=1656892 RepID=A0A849AAT4_9ACTN|nr:DinB family protein [Nakamurella aerolata]NNG37057.1 DinB family protein [Nakamurella aerolata]